MGFATNAIHVGQEPDPSTGAVVAPIYQTSTYVYEELGKAKGGYDYARTNHPNRKALERTVAKLEGGHAAYVFTSGMAGIDAVFRLTAARRPRGSVRGGLRRRLPALHATPGALRAGIQLRGYHRPGRGAGRTAPEHENAVHRDADESHACALQTSPRWPSWRTNGTILAGGGQHVPDSLPAAARSNLAHTSSFIP